MNARNVTQKIQYCLASLVQQHAKHYTNARIAKSRLIILNVTKFVSLKKEFMTIVIKKSDSKEQMKRKLKKLQNHASVPQQKTFKELSGALKGVFKEDALELQRKWRSEWD